MSNIQTGTYLGRFVDGHFVHVGLPLGYQMRRHITHIDCTSTLESDLVLIRIRWIEAE